MSKGTNILVICSLVLNVLFVGVIIGHFSHRFRDEGFPVRPWHERMPEFPEGKQELFNRTMEQVRLRNLDIHRQIRETREKALAILTAPDFDETAYKSVMTKLHNLRGKMMQNMADATADLARQLDRDGRKALAESLQRPMMPRGDDRPNRHGEDRPRRRMP